MTRAAAKQGRGFESQFEEEKPSFAKASEGSFLSVADRKLAGWTGLEPAAFCVTGRRSNQLSYHPVKRERGRNVDSDLGKSSVVWNLTGRGILEEIERVLPVRADL